MDIELLKDVSGIERFTKDEIIIEDGETQCDEMYILLKGTAGVYKHYGEHDQVKIAMMKPGDFFGEMSLFLGKERMATVVAAEDVEALCLNPENAFEFIATHPQATFSLVKTLCSRLASSNSAYKHLYKETHPSQAERIENYVSDSFTWLMPEEHKEYSKRVNYKRAGELTEKTFECPICANTFTAQVKAKPEVYTFLRPAKGSTSFYFDVVTCENCWFSAFSDMFGLAVKDNKVPELFSVNREFHSANVNAALRNKDNILGVFVKHYLALECLPDLFERYDEVRARLWLRLSWLYYDCEDEALELNAVKNARSAYIAVLQKKEFRRDMVSLIHYIAGELSFKIEDYSTASAFFNRVLENITCAPELKRRALERSEDVNECMRELVARMRASSGSADVKGD